MSDINLSGIGYTTGLDMNYGRSGPVYNRYANYDLTWETGKKLNLGVDFHLLNDIRVVLDIFREDRTNIFQQRGTIPTYLGTAGDRKSTRLNSSHVAISYAVFC